MLRLSQKAWNNVIIFTMLLMILLFSTTSNILNTGTSEGDVRLLLPENVPIMKIDYGNMKIERIGQSWRVLTNNTGADLTFEPQNIVQHWQMAKIGASSAAEQQPLVVVVWLAGEVKGRVFKLYIAENKLQANGKFYQLSDVHAQNLLISD